MKLIFIGAPGSGKGTQAKMVSETFNILHLSTGDILRSEINSKTDLGKKVEHYTNSGNLVPDKVMVELIGKIISEKKCRNGFVLDGYPRTIGQAKSLHSLFIKLNFKLDKVIFFYIDEEILIERLSGRYVNPKTGATYNLKYNPSIKEGICDVDSTKLIRRVDDEPNKVKDRLNIYKIESDSLRKYYMEDKDKLLEIDANNSIKSINEKIIKNLSYDD